MYTFTYSSEMYVKTLKQLSKMYKDAMYNLAVFSAALHSHRDLGIGGIITDWGKDCCVGIKGGSG